MRSDPRDQKGLSDPRAVYAEWDDDAAFGWADERPAAPAPAGPPWLRTLVLYRPADCRPRLFRRAQEQERLEAGPKRVPASVLVAPDPGGSGSPPPRRLCPGGNAAPVAMQARVHTSGAREDTLILGRFGDPAMRRSPSCKAPPNDPAASLSTPSAGRRAPASQWRIRARAR